MFICIQIYYGVYMSNVAIDPPLFIDSIVNYCDNLQQTPFPSCTKEMHIRIGQCEECLEAIHYETVDASYQCLNSCYVYICKYVHKYASEIYRALEEIDFSTIPHQRILSLGCGPATELCALDYLKSINTIQGYDYTGVDLNNNWSTIQNFYRENSPNGSNIIFQISDVNNFIDQCTITDYDLIIMNYFLSDMVKIGGKASVKELLEKIIEKMNLMKHYPSIIFNDIGVISRSSTMGATDLVKDLLFVLPVYTRKSLSYFVNAKSGSYAYRYLERDGFIKKENTPLSFNPPDTCTKYSPYKTMSAAQIILQT